MNKRNNNGGLEPGNGSEYDSRLDLQRMPLGLWRIMINSIRNIRFFSDDVRWIEDPVRILDKAVDLA